jgi:UDP-N-acetylglucosamine 2-epimerase (non-hydrolysing)/GDP/UDP-N,N'-diacetylbacillosamine 2-epimerase (hydrolysing)
MIKIFIITERRADYSRFKPIMKLIKQDDSLDYILAVTGAHIIKDMGYTKDEIVNDGFDIDYEIDMFKENIDSAGAMVRSFARVSEQVTYCLEDSKPDIILSGFDIGANLAVTIAGAHMNIPVAHIQGGEVTGTIDESIRHAMTKFSHYHFASNQDAVERLVKLGEMKERIFNVGCPSIDAIINTEDDPKILEKFNLKENQYFILLQHPVTSEIENSKEQIQITLSAIQKSNISTLIIMPNNDAGYSSIIRELKSSKIQYVESLGIKDYINLLKRSSGLIGNSSSGIHETSTFNVPTINIGTRQNGRLRSENVIDVNHNEDEIINAIKKAIEFNNKGKKVDNLYGDGNSAERIVEIIKKIDLSNDIIQKTITY